jgi:hypothetical protein
MRIPQLLYAIQLRNRVTGERSLAPFAPGRIHRVVTGSSGSTDFMTPNRVDVLGDQPLYTEAPISQLKYWEDNIQEACIVTYELHEVLDVRVGVRGIRDPDCPCTEFLPGPPDRFGNCETDGHYMCRECSHMKDPDDDR